MYQMSCKTISATMLPIKRHEITVYKPKNHKIEVKNDSECVVKWNLDKNFSFLYCVSYRHPSLPEWILARWYWNDQWIWTNEDIWNDF